MTNILITTSQFDVAQNAALKILQDSGFTAILNPFGRRLTEEDVLALLATHRPVGMIAGIEPLTARCFDVCPELKVISRCGTGLDSVDLPAAAERGITVLNTPDAPSRSVAELTLALILGSLRRITEADRALRAGRWQALMGDLLYGRVLGIVGFGRIGRRVAGLAAAFGAQIIAHDAATDPAAADGPVEMVDLPTLLARSDIVTLHLGYGPDVHHLIDEGALRLMKRGAFLVNTARGGLVDEEALAAALRDGHLAGAAIDVFEQEPYSGPLTGIDTALLTAHMGSYSRQSRALMEAEAAENLRHALLSR